MSRWLKWTGATLALAGLTAGLAAVAVDLLGERKRRRVVQVQVAPLPPVDAPGGEIRLPLAVKGLYAFGLLRDAAEVGVPRA